MQHKNRTKLKQPRLQEFIIHYSGTRVRYDLKYRCSKTDSEAIFKLVKSNNFE